MKTHFCTQDTQDTQDLAVRAFGPAAVIGYPGTLSGQLWTAPRWVHVGYVSARRSGPRIPVYVPAAEPTLRG